MRTEGYRDKNMGKGDMETRGYRDGGILGHRHGDMGIQGQ